MARIQAFRGVRPRSEIAGEVVAPPYDVLSEAEARAIVARLPRSFLRVTRPEVGLESGVDAHGAEAYAEGRKAFTEFLAEGTLVRDEAPCLYLYGQRMGDHEQVGLIGLCSVAEYDRGDIAKHEYTRPDKEQDRVDHIRAVGAQTGLVFLTYRQTDVLEQLLEWPSESPLWDVTTDDGVQHCLWRLADSGSITAITRAFDDVSTLYIADGHHRSAAASRIAAERAAGAAEGWFIAGVFPDTRLQVLAYNRLVADLAGHSSTDFLTALNEHFEVQEVDQGVPAARGQIHMFLSGRWHCLERRSHLASSDPVSDLDVAVLQEYVLSPLLGIQDPRRDTRIQFVGGIRGTEVLASAVDAGEAAVAFSLYPTALAELFRVADAGEVMPPKSTWFEPKLRGGVVVNPLDD